MIELNLKEKWINQMYGGKLETWCIWIERAIETIRSKNEKEIEIITTCPAPNGAENGLREPHPELGYTTVRFFCIYLPDLDNYLIDTLKGILVRNHINLREASPRSITLRIF